MARLSDSITYGDHAITGDANVGGKLSVNGDTVLEGDAKVAGALIIRENRWNSSSLTGNALYTDPTGSNGFAFGNGTGVSTWFTYNGTLRRAIDCANNGSYVNINPEIRAGNGISVSGSSDHAYNGIRSVSGNSGHLMLDSNGGNVYLNWHDNGEVRIEGSLTRVESPITFESSVSGIDYDDLAGATSVSGDVSYSGNVEAGRGGGGVALTVNDGQGNANVTFNHANGIAEQAGNIGRIEVNSDSTSGAYMGFHVNNNSTAGSVTANEIMKITPSGVSLSTGSFTGSGAGLTGTASLRATGTTKGDVGLSNVPNTDATNASNIGSGTLNYSRLPSKIVNEQAIIRDDGNPISPNDFTRSVVWKFTQQSVLNSPPGIGSWRNVATIHGWTTYSSSYPTYQLSFGNGAVAVRQSTSTTSWAGWRTLVEHNGTYSGLRAQATTKGDVGLGSVDNYSRSHYDGRYFRKDVTDQTITTGQGEISFGYSPPPGASSIRSSGNLMIDSPDQNSVIFLQWTGGNNGVNFCDGANSVVARVDGTGNFTCDGDITAQGNVTAYSDIRIKTNIEVIPDAIEKVQKLSGYTYDRTDKEVPRQTGVIAQELLNVLPEAVRGGPTEEDPDGHYSVAYGNMVGLLIEGMKEQQNQIDKQQQQMDNQQKQIEELRRMIK